MLTASSLDNTVKIPFKAIKQKKKKVPNQSTNFKSIKSSMLLSSNSLVFKTIHQNKITNKMGRTL
jgi:hypothetical protein